jgi:hypothetical protein
VTSWNILQIPAYDLEHLRRETENVAGHGCVDVEGEGKSNCGGRFLLLTARCLHGAGEEGERRADKLPRFSPDRARRGRVPLKGVGGRRRRARRAGLQLVPRVLQCQRARDSTSLEVLSKNVHVPQVLGYDNRALRLLRTILKCMVGRVVHLDSSHH